MQTVFFTDLDNTMIYSYKHDIGNKKKCVEMYQGREVSFMTDRTRALLQQIAKEILIVPITTRTVEQYRRIELGVGEMPLALVCNGGVLLSDGIEDENWYRESLELTAHSQGELKKAEALLAIDSCRSFEVRNVNDLFIFTKSSRPRHTVKRLSDSLDTSVVDVLNNGVKVYVVPAALNKGKGLQRLAEQLGAEKTIAAGDSAFDISMLTCADYAFAPAKLAEHMAGSSGVITINDQEIFSEKLLEYVKQIVKRSW